MSFHFKRIRLKDWLVYGGDTEVRFPDFEGGRNLVVFNGRNGFGKTSLLRALKFVFDGRATKDEIKDLWNERARGAGEGSLEVCLEFAYGSRMCEIVRGADFRPWGGTISCAPWVKLFIDGREEKDQIEDKIEEILPEDCLEFVFFDGAEISRYAQKQHQEGVREAIEKVLGIPAVRNLRDDLKKVIDDLQDEQESLLLPLRQQEGLLGEIDKLRSEREKYENDRRGLMDKKRQNEKMKMQVEDEVARIEEIERERNELSEKQRRLSELSERQSQLDNEIKSLIAQTPILMLRNPLRMIVEEVRADMMSSNDRDTDRATLKVLRELLERNSCLCGHEMDLDISGKLREELLRIEQSFIEEGDEHEAAAEDFPELASLLARIEQLRGDPQLLVDERSALAVRQDELETDIRRLTEGLDGHKDIHVREAHQRIRQFMEDIAALERQIDVVQQNIDKTETDLRQKQRTLDAIAASHEQTRGVTRTLEHARRIHRAVSDLVEQLVLRKREQIQQVSTEVFRKITNKPEEFDSLHITAQYSIEVVRKEGSTVENQKLSSGEKEVVAYSFITALNMASENPAPFVMDTPFGHLDYIHRSGLLRSLPKLQVQAVLLATDRDLPAEERDKIDSSIAKEFTLKRDQTRGITTIEED